MASESPPGQIDGRTKTVAAALLGYLRMEGVDRIFGYPGTAQQYVLEELRKAKDIDFVICRQETGAAYIADAYSRITGKLGTVFVTTGPGATNALTGVVNAQSMNSSLLVITAEVAQKYWGRAALQAGVDGPLDVVRVFDNACQYSARISAASSFDTLMRQALREAMSIPHRAVHISLPDDIANQPVDDHPLTASHVGYRAAMAGAPESQVARLLEILTRSALPLLWLGNGCRRVLFPAERAEPQEAARIEARRRRFFEFIERFCLPVMTTGNAKGVFPESNPLSLRNYGLGGSPWPSAYVRPARSSPGLNAKYDALCVLGSSLSQLGTDTWAAEMMPIGPFVQVDADHRVIGRGYSVDFGIVAELGAVIDQLVQLAEGRQPDPALCQQRRDYVEKIRAIAYPKANPQAEYIIALSDHLPRNSHVFVDACSADFLSLLYFVVDPPMHMHNSLIQGPIGSAIAGVVGAAFASDRPCVAICGDGGFLMHGSEINTAAKYRLGCLWIVFQNEELGTVSQKMEKEFPDGDGAKPWREFFSIGQADLVSFARGLGADAMKVASPQALGPAVQRALAQGKERRRPQVIIVPTRVYPPPAAGAG